MGRTYVGGNIVKRSAYGASNVYQGILTVYSGAGPIQSLDQYFVDRQERSIDGDGIVGIGLGLMGVKTQLGLAPAAAALAWAIATPPDWSADCKISGMAASATTLKYETKGSAPMTSVPETGWVGHWVKVYDPRKDGSYPGGLGAHRPDDESTWEWSDNPALHGLTWLLGRRQNGTLVLGVGAEFEGIIVDQFCEWANVCEANGWRLGGVVYSTDDKWNVFKQICQAGGAEPLCLGAQIGVLVNTPRVSLATIGVGDVVGDASVQATQARRDRINAIVPRCRFESLGWQIDAASPVVVDDYVAFDGRLRQREIEYSLVQCDAGENPTQAVQLARYDIENAREFGPVTLPLKLRWYGYKPGDVVTVNLPELGLNDQDILIRDRTLSAESGLVTLTARSETAGKHPFALGQTGTPPATPGVSGAVLVPTPGGSAWEIAGTTVSSDGVTIPALVVTGAVDSDVIDEVVFEYRLAVVGGGSPGPWQAAGSDAPAVQRRVITGVQDSSAYQVSVQYRRGPALGGRRIIGPATAGRTLVTAGLNIIDNDAVPVPAEDLLNRFLSLGFDGTTLNLLRAASGGGTPVNISSLVMTALNSVAASQLLPDLRRPIEDTFAASILAMGEADQLAFSQGQSNTVVYGSLTAVKNDASASVTKIDVIAARVGTAEASITSLQSVNASLNGTVATLSTTVSAQSGTIASQGAAIGTLTSGLAAANSTLTANTSAIGGLTSSLASLSSTVTAQATSIGSLNTFSSSASATLSAHATSLGTLSASYTVRLNVNGRASGFGLADGSGGTSEFAVLANRFLIIDPSNDGVGAYPFEVVGGVVKIKNALIGTLAAANIAAGVITYDKLVANTLTADTLAPGAVAQGNFRQTFGGGSFSSTSTWTDIAYSSLTPPEGQPIKGLASAFLARAGSGTTKVQLRLIRDDGTEIWPVAEIKVQDEGTPVCIPFIDQVAAGRATTWTLQAKKSASSDTVNYSATLMYVEELSRIALQGPVIDTGGAGGGAGGGAAGSGSGSGWYYP